MNLGASSRDIDAGMNNVSCKFRRRLLQDHFDGIADRVEVVLDRLIDNSSRHLHLNRQTTHHVASDNHHGLGVARDTASEGLLHALRGLLSDDKIVLALHISDNGFVDLVAAGM